MTFPLDLLLTAGVFQIETDLLESELEKSTCCYKHTRTFACCCVCSFSKQKYLLSNPAHQSSAVDEHFFLNESAAQVR